MIFSAPANQYLNCPMCDCEIPTEGEESAGDEVSCPYCETPLKIRKNKEDELSLEENF